MSFHKPLYHDTATRSEYHATVPARRPPNAFVRDCCEASGRNREWLRIIPHRRHLPDRTFLGVVCVVMARRGYTPQEITAATGCRRIEAYTRHVVEADVRRMQRQLRKAGR